MKTTERLQAEIELTEALIVQIRDDLKTKELFTPWLEVRRLRKKKKTLFSRLKKLKDDLKMSNQLPIFKT